MYQTPLNYVTVTSHGTKRWQTHECLQAPRGEYHHRQKGREVLTEVRASTGRNEKLKCLVCHGKQLDTLEGSQAGTGGFYSNDRDHNTIND